MNLTLHATGHVQIGEGQPPAERRLSVDAQILPPTQEHEAGGVLLTITDSLSPTFSLDIKLTAMQASQLGFQLCDLAQEAQHAHLLEKPLIVLPDPPVPPPNPAP